MIRERREMREKGLVKNKCFLDFLLDISSHEKFTEDDCEKEACTSIFAVRKHCLIDRSGNFYPLYMGNLVPLNYAKISSSFLPP